MDHEHRHRRIEVLGRANPGWRVCQDDARVLLSQFAGKYWKERIFTSREVRFKGTSRPISSPLSRKP
jgi:hypothetical protein